MFTQFFLPYFFLFCFLVIFVILMHVLSVLFLVAMISLTLRFLMKSSSHCIDATSLTSMLQSPLPPSFLDTYSLWTSCKALWIVISFLVLRSIFWSFPLVHFKNSPEYFTRWTVQVLIPFMRFLQYSLISWSLLVPLRYSSYFFSFISL